MATQQSDPQIDSQEDYDMDVADAIDETQHDEAYDEEEDGETTISSGEEESDEGIISEESSEAADLTKEDIIKHHHEPIPPFPHLRDISSLASWRVSSHKPGCGVAALRNASNTQFWQSDGPQPHHLNIHFFKMVAIAHMRLYLDFEMDESYTPTKLQFWAGTGFHDLQMVTEIKLERPKGWLDVDLTDAGGPSEFGEGEEWEDDLEEEDAQMQAEMMGRGPGAAQEMEKRRKRARVGRGPTLRCFLVQVRILENHQNGKDTHLRGLQIFAKDPVAAMGRRRRRLVRNSLGVNGVSEVIARDRIVRPREPIDLIVDSTTMLGEPDWMGDPIIR